MALAATAPMAATRLVGPLLVDAHVHFYPCFAPERFLDAAAANVAEAGRRLALVEPPIGCLLLTETPDMHWFRRWRDEGAGGEGPWSLRPTQDGIGLLALRGGQPRLVLVAGRQIATREGLEVLALGCDRDFPRGLAFPDALRASVDAGAVTVVPWGFGKWWFRRRRLVRWLVDTAAPGTVFLGDNGGRARLGRDPALFARARARGLLVLRGSDPLPFTNQETRAGGFGFVLPGTVRAETAAADLLRHLGALRRQPIEFGRLQPPVTFLATQLRMHLRKHLGRQR